MPEPYYDRLVSRQQIGANTPLFPMIFNVKNEVKQWHEIEATIEKTIMENSKETIGILNDLVLINNDRIAGYEKALEELKAKDNSEQEDLDLTVLFEKMIDDSREFRNALGKEVQVLGGEMAEGTMTSGKIYRAWMDVKALFTGKDRHTILASCEMGEDAAQKAYKAALEDEHLPHFLNAIISEQKGILREAHDEIKALRDQVA